MSEKLLSVINQKLEQKIISSSVDNDEVTIEVSPKNYHSLCTELLAEPEFLFEQLIDLCGVDYSTYPEKAKTNQARFAVVLHLLSLRKNQRLRVRVFADDDSMPIVSTITDIWASADWYEREAFDLFGIIFDGHHDLRRILTDYGFIGHPFRKDFPMVGKLEMRYDPDQQRVVYQPVTIDERIVVPKVFRS